MDYIQVSGKTEDAAVIEAAARLATTREHLTYEIIEKGSSGFLGIGSHDYVIKARALTDSEIEELENISEENKIQGEKPQEEKEIIESTVNEEIYNQTSSCNVVNGDSSHETTKVILTIDKIQAETEKFMSDMFKAMNMDVNTTFVFHEEDRSVDIELSGSNMGILIGKRGQTLDSIQYLLSLYINKYSDDYIRVKVDTENYRQRRKETLENLAKNISYKVKRSRKSVSLEPMNPYERRIIHSALQSDHAVSTHSEGDEPFRHVVISLKDSSYKKRER